MTALRPGTESSEIRFGSFRLHRTQGLRHEDHEVRVTPKSLCVLWELASQAGVIVTKEQLFRAVWAGTAVSDSALTSCIQELRQALQDDPRRPQYIETLHRRGYRFLAPNVAAAAEEQAANVTRAPIVRRHQVVSDILNIWSAAERGARQLLFLGGEPGIGKTTVAQQILATVTASGRATATWGQCLQHYGVGEPYQPLLEALMRLCSQPGRSTLIPLLERYAPTWLAQLPALVPPERYERLRRTVAGATRPHMLRELTDALEAATADGPLALCLEDLHWSDVSTLDWIAAFAQRPEPAPVLLIGTFRPQTDDAGGHPLLRVIEELHIKRCCREITLSGMTENEVADFVALRLPPAPAHGQDLRRLALLVHRHSGGNPLFVLNVLDDLVARRLIFEQNGRWALSADLAEVNLGIPDDVRRIIGAQLERLPASQCALLEVASVAGSTFSAATVAGAAGLATSDVEATLTGLARQRRFVRHSGPRFGFDHDLYRDVLYERVPAARRSLLHREVGEREQASHGERAREIAAELAMHFERSGDIRRAGMYLQQAAENAQSRSAFTEARSHFQKALSLLQNEPACRERTEREINLWIGLGAAAMAARGWGTQEAEKAYSRARELCNQLGDSPELFPALWGLWLFYWGRGPLQTAHELAEDLLRLAQSRGEDSRLLQAHHAAWATAFSRGNLNAACLHAQEGIRLYDRHRHAPISATYGNHDPGVCARLFLARALALLGRSEEAFRSNDDAIALAQQLEHPFSLAVARVFAAATAHACRQLDRVRVHARAAASISRDQDFRLLAAWSSAFEGWTAVLAGDREDGLRRIEDAIAQARRMGSEQFLPHLAGLAAEAYLVSGNATDGLKSVEDGLQVTLRTGERFWQPELLRLKGELHITQDPRAAGEAEQAFRAAIDCARREGSMLLALRAAVSLGRLLRRAGRINEAHSLVSGISHDLDHWTGTDINEAKILLNELTNR